jgi:hypothetical protein
MYLYVMEIWEPSFTIVLVAPARKKASLVDKIMTAPFNNVLLQPGPLLLHDVLGDVFCSNNTSESLSIAYMILAHSSSPKGIAIMFGHGHLLPPC